MMDCMMCNKPLSGGMDTYGDHSWPLCFDCNRECEELENEQSREWYGVSPHVHDMTRTGTFIGSTVLLELPEPDKHGWRDLAPLGGWYANYMFCEDEAGPGCGVYVRKDAFEGTRTGVLIES